MKDPTVRAGTLSAIHESMNVPSEHWHGFCLGFSTGHLGWALELREVETAQLDHEPIPTREKSEPALDCAFLRQIGHDSEAKKFWISYYHKGYEKEWTLEQPRNLDYERIRGDEKELRIDLENGTSVLVQLHLVDVPERVGDDNRP
jgi:hypothetical protein